MMNLWDSWRLEGLSAAWRRFRPESGGEEFEGREEGRGSGSMQYGKH